MSVVLLVIDNDSFNSFNKGKASKWMIIFFVSILWLILVKI